MQQEIILITGASGQLGTELTTALQQKYGANYVIATDIRKPAHHTGIFELLDVMQAQKLAALVDRYKVTQIYHLAAILSAKGEESPLFTWNINMQTLLNVLEVAREKKLTKVYTPSSIAVFGQETPKTNTPQGTVLTPQTVYGISKVAGENWCQYYFERYGVDVRSIRYPGLISYAVLPGGGTTDYAVDIFYKAIEKGSYTCFLKKDTYLPMMYMPDAVRATLELMEAESSTISVRSSYNLSAFSFSPEEIANAIQQHMPSFSIDYKPDHRQQIAESWSQSIDDSTARNDWGWKPAYTLESMSEDMILNLSKKLNKYVSH